MNKKKILDYWNLRAGKEILKCTNDINLESNEIKIFLSIIKKKKNVLDIGCGEGFASSYFFKNPFGKIMKN